MKSLAFFPLLLLVSLSAHAGIKADVTVVQRQDVERKAIPVFSDVLRKEDGSVAVTVSLKEHLGVVGEFAAYELRVSKTPISASGIRGDFFKLDTFARRISAREKVVKYELTKDEIPKSYIVISWWTGQRSDGMATMKNQCLPISYLVDREQR